MSAVSKQTSQPDNPPVKILLIEDDPKDAELVVSGLTEAGSDWFELIHAKEMGVGLDLAARLAPDVALIDLTMPGGEGLDPLKRLKNVLPYVPILILTSLYDTRLSIQAVRSGAQDFLVKGEIRGAALKRLICHAVERQKVTTNWDEGKVQRQQELEKQAVTDTLTGLFNRRHLRDRLLQEMFRAERYGSPLSLLLMDPDHFKQVNDTYGHNMGDEVLARLGAIIKHKARTTDIAGRYGGDEFCVILTVTGADGAELFAHRLIQMFEAQVFRAEDGREFRVSCSAGVAAYDKNVIDTVGFIKRADIALYQAKTGGRNRVCVYGGALSS